jgi:hypothetical protein
MNNKTREAAGVVPVKSSTPMILHGWPTVMKIWNKCKFLGDIFRTRANGAIVKEWKFSAIGNADEIGYQFICFKV